MARLSPAQKLRRILNTIRAWEKHDPRATFFGYTLAQFKAAVKPSLDAHAKIAELRDELRLVVAARDLADKRSLRIVYGVGWAVDGNPAHGSDSDLHEDLGFTRHAVRTSRIRAARRRRPIKK
jgi:hypothetical protein